MSLDLKQQVAMDLNVHVQILDKHGKLKSDKHFKNTATKRMTDGIALFLAGDGAAENKGAWRPNFISFGTTGILHQPTADHLVLTEDDLEPDFANKTPAENVRTRPWFYSTWLGERCPENQHDSANDPPSEKDGCWSPAYGWKVFNYDPNNPRTFQGELVTYNDGSEDVSYDSDLDQLYRRHPILRADVTLDRAYQRDVGFESFSTDCIFYGYASVKWCNSFFKPENGEIEIPRLAISEIGLFEKDSYPVSGLKTMMAGFRVPTVDDIIYVEPDEVMLVEWRVTIRAMMPGDGVVVTDGVNPVGIAMDVVKDETPGVNRVKVTATVRPANANQSVAWELDAGAGTTMQVDGNEVTVTLGPQDSTGVFYVSAHSTINEGVAAKTAVLTGLVTDIVTGVAVTLESSLVETNQYQFSATVFGKGEFDQNVTWALTGNESAETILSPNGLLTIGQDESADQLVITVTSVGDNEIHSVATILRANIVSGSYVVSDFSILTE